VSGRAEGGDIRAPEPTPEWRLEMFRRYAEERRAARIPKFRLEQSDDLTRHLPNGADDEALLSFGRFPAAAADARIREELARLRGHGWEAEWKVHDFDRPADLRSRLEASGLTAHHVEAWMVLDIDDAFVKQPATDGIVVEKASGPTLDALAQFQEEIWKCRLPWLAGVLHEMTDPVNGSGVAFHARSADRIVGSGWIDFQGGSRFAQLSGGAVLEAYRGRGVYSMLFERRLIEAKARGVPFIAVDAAPMSRPILERKGFRFICHTYPMRTRPFDTIAVTRS
jgi:GNAT superfamily N-acetyltransferase